VRFSEINLFGVYIAPIAPLLLVAWMIVIGLRWIAAYCGFLRYVWHSALFVFWAYMIVLWALVHFAGL
jgi:hypothetical protein